MESAHRSQPWGAPALARPTRLASSAFCQAPTTGVAHCCPRLPVLVNSYPSRKAQFECYLLRGGPPAPAMTLCPPLSQYSSSVVPLFGYIPISPTRLLAPGGYPGPCHSTFSGSEIVTEGRMEPGREFQGNLSPVVSMLFLICPGPAP